MTDLIAGVVGGIVNTRAAILAMTPTAGVVAYATDTGEMLMADGTDWRAAPLELDALSTTPDMGVESVNDRSGYYRDTITDKALANCQLGGNANATEGALRTTASGVFQIYLNGTWNDVVINFVLREDASGAYELEHAPIGFEYYYELMSGNSDELGLDGRPLIQQYVASMGPYQPNITIDGGSF